ncbi:MAG: peptidoglycan-binding protein [Sedimentibacter sp.]|nr:peptidoglycan-binding protein [Sedimentibacter sp.]
MIYRNSINNNTNEEFFFPGGAPTVLVTIPENITVHLGSPTEEAENITVPFIDYIKNVASSELYPTWPENALRANIHAIVSIALNRVVLQWYRSRGYQFDITNSTQYDQAYVKGRGTYESTDRIVDEIFNDYVAKNGQILPLFTTFCDGRVTQCNGLYQWGTVDLANQGYSPMDIIKYYYGEDIYLVENVPSGEAGLSYPGEPIKLGDSSLFVLSLQLVLNRIAKNFPAIPEITPVNGYFGDTTEAAVREFQRVFNLPVTGIVDKGTYYKVSAISAAVSKLAELTGQVSLNKEIIERSRLALLQGDIRPAVDLLQFFLNVLSVYYESIPSVAYTGVFDTQTRAALIEFQKRMGLPITGILDRETGDLLFRTAYGILRTLPPQEIILPIIRYPGIEFRKGMGLERPSVFLIQQALSYISLTIPLIPQISEEGIFGEETENAVIAFQNIFGLEPTGVVNEATWNELVRVYQELRLESQSSAI